METLNFKDFRDLIGSKEQGQTSYNQSARAIDVPYDNSPHLKSGGALD